MRNLKAPHIQHYISWLHRLDYGRVGSCISYDEKTYELLDELYLELRKLAPMGDRNRRELWLRAERGSLEDWGNIDEMVEDGEFDCREDAESYWQDMFPEEAYWYHLLTIEDDDTGFRGLFLGHQYIIEVNPGEPESAFPHNISPLAEWLLSEVKRCVVEVENGTYNANVQRNLPPQHRTGTIVRKDLYDIFPEERKEYFEDLCDEDREYFILNAREEAPKERLPSISANDFYTFCSLGYVVNGYEHTDLPLRKQYDRHADGRDEGLGEIDQDSPEAFLDWFENREQYGGHPWEVCRGGNSTHISLYVYHDAKGYFLNLAGSSWGRTIETVKFFNALHRRGIPVCVREADILVERMMETEKIGIVPEGIMPAYCEMYFPGEDIIAFRNLPEEHREEVAKHCLWQNVPEVKLA